MSVSAVCMAVITTCHVEESSLDWTIIQVIVRVIINLTFHVVVSSVIGGASLSR